MENFHQAYCNFGFQFLLLMNFALFLGRIFTLFISFWVFSNPSTIMEFNVIKDRFIEAIVTYLEEENANLLEAKLCDDFTFV